MGDVKGILVFVEVVNGAITMVTKELLGAGRKLADGLVEQELCAVIMGTGQADVAAEVIALGADTAYTIDEAAFDQHNPELVAMALGDACRQLKPAVVIMGHTDLGRDVGPRVAGSLGNSLVTDCVGLGVSPDKSSIVIIRPVFGGKAMAEYTAEMDAPQMVTIRSHAMAPAKLDAARQGKINPLAVSIDTSLSSIRLVETVKEEVEGIKLEEAKVVVAGGRGVGSAEGFGALQELAKVLKGAVGATREPCDEGWVSSKLKIGQTGIIVNPDLYFAIGISGASQHVAGITGSKCIVAINTDSEATILKVSDFAVVADYAEVIPALTEELKRLG